MGSAIYRARREAGLTCVELGRQLGLQGRAVFRWELGQNAPSKRHRQQLVAAIEVLNQGAAAKLAVAFGLAPSMETAVAAAASAPVAGPAAFDLFVFAMAEKLEVAPRLLRGSMLELLQHLRETNVSSAWAEQHLAQQLRPAPVDGPR